MNLFYFPHKRMHILPSNHHSICADMVREKRVVFSRKSCGNVLKYFSIEPTVFSLPRWTSHVQNKIYDKQRTTQNSTGHKPFSKHFIRPLICKNDKLKIIIAPDVHAKTDSSSNVILCGKRK